MDTILRRARTSDGPDAALVDIGISGGTIAAIEPELMADAEVIDVDGRLMTAGFVETHIHLDKSCILDRLSSRKGGLNEAIGEVARLKGEFTAQGRVRAGQANSGQVRGQRHNSHANPLGS